MKKFKGYIAGLLIIVLALVIFVPPQIERYQITQAAINAIVNHDKVTRDHIQIREIQARLGRTAQVYPYLGATWEIDYRILNQQNKLVPSNDWYVVSIIKTKNGYQAEFEY